MGYELTKLMSQYGISTPTMAPYTGTKTPGAQYDADQQTYNQYKDAYQNRLANTDMYNQSQFSTNNANVPAILTLSSAQKNALGAVPAPTGEATAGQQLYGVDQSGLNRTINDYMSTSPSTNDLMAFKQKYGINDWDIRNAMGTGEQRGAQQWNDTLRAPTYTPIVPATTTPATTTPTATPDIDPGPSDEPGIPWYKKPTSLFDAIRYYDGYTSNYAEGGAVKGYQDGGAVDRTAALQAMLDRYSTQGADYSNEVTAAQKKLEEEESLLNNMLTQQVSSLDKESKAELYLRLAAAFGSPTKTGHFSENLALANKEGADYKRQQRENQANKQALLTALQQRKRDAASKELMKYQTYERERAAQNAALQKDILGTAFKEEIKSQYRTPEFHNGFLVDPATGEVTKIPEYLDAQERLRAAGRTQVNVGGDKPTEFEKQLDKKDAAYYADLRGLAMDADNTIDQLNVIKDISSKTQTGKTEEALAMAGQYFGTEAGASMQALNAVSNRLVLDLSMKMKGALSEGDRKRLEESVPRFGLDPKANEIVIGLLEKAIQRSKDNYYAADSYISENRSLRGFKPPSYIDFSGNSATKQGEYTVGDIIEENGKKYRVTGGDPNDPDVEEL